MHFRWNEIDFEQQQIHVWTRKRKGGAKQYRSLPMGAKLAEVFSRLQAGRTDESKAYVFINPRTGGPYGKQHADYKNMMQRLCEKAGVEFFCLSSLRHYVAQHLVRSGASVLDSQAILGHKRATTTDNYLRTYAPDNGRLGRLLDGQFL